MNLVQLANSLDKGGTNTADCLLDFLVPLNFDLLCEIKQKINILLIEFAFVSNAAKYWGGKRRRIELSTK